MRSLRLLALLLVVVLVGPLFSPYNPGFSDETNYGKLHAPSLTHPFGTDKLARDVMSRVLTGAQLSLEISVTAVCIALLIGTAYGLLAAMAGGRSDAALMRALDVGLSVPRILLLLPIAATWPFLRVWMLALILGLSGWFEIARLVRGDAQGILVRDFVLATKAMGVGRFRLVVRHLLPHLLPTLLVAGTLALGTTIALEAGLAFLGLGISSAAPSLGTLLHDSIASPDYWWLSVFPGLTIVLIMLGCNILGDTLRAAFAPPQLHA
jgi:peptide/nickel transport system permease protein